MNWNNKAESLYKGFLALVCIFGVALYFHPDRLSLWLDELYSVTNTYHWSSFSKLFWHTLVRDGTSPLYQSLLYAWTHLFGVSDYMVRFPSAVFAATTVVVAFVYGRMIIGVNHSLLLAALLAVS